MNPEPAPIAWSSSLKNSPSSACTEGVLTALLKKVLWFLSQPVNDMHPLIFDVISYTLGMSPSPLWGELVPFFKYVINYKSNQPKLDRRIGGSGGDSVGLSWSHLDSLGLT